MASLNRILAPERAFRVGEWLVERQLNTVSKPDKTSQLEPKVMQVLLCLAERSGEVLSKDYLIQKVWPDVFVTDDVLTRSISELRKVFGDDAKEPQFIQTVPKRGYRLIVPVTFVDNSASRRAPDISIATPTQYQSRVVKRFRIVTGVLLTLLVAGIAFGSYRFIRSRQPAQNKPPGGQRQLTRLTFDSGLQGEPSWSPDGRFIAYSSDRNGNFDIWVKPVAGGDAVQVTRSQAHDWQPNWSPDNSQIAFRSERDGGGIFVVPALGGYEQRVSSFGHEPHWSPDSSKILFQSSNMQFAPGYGELRHFYLVSTNGDTPRQVLKDLQSQVEGIWSVDWHPDGERVTVWGWSRDFGCDAYTATLSDGKLVRSGIDAEVKKQFNEAKIRIRKVRWAPSGSALYIEGESRDVESIWRVPVDPETLRFLTGPERLTTSPGRDAEIALSRDGTKLAFSSRIENRRLWLVPIDALTGKVSGDGQPVGEAGKYNQNATLSRDGRKVAFNALMEKGEFRVKSLEDGSEKRLFADDIFRGPMKWSHDDTHLVYGRGSSAGNSMAIVSADGGDEKIITSPGRHAEMPWDWSHDGQWILASSWRLNPERLPLCLYPVAAAPHAETAARVVAADSEHTIFDARFSPDERWICFMGLKPDEPGVAVVYVVPVSGGKWTRITTDNYWNDNPTWSPDGRIIYFTSNRKAGFHNVWGIRFDPVSGKQVGEPFQVTYFESPGRMLLPLLQRLELMISRNRLVVTIQEVSGSVWTLNNVDR